MTDGGEEEDTTVGVPATIRTINAKANAKVNANTRTIPNANANATYAKRRRRSGMTASESR